MASRYYYLFIVFGILLIVATSISIGFAIFQLENLPIGFFLVLLLIVEIVIFNTRLNTINRKIASFFNSVQNEDTSLHLPKDNKSSTISEIYKSLNQIVSVFQKIKIESEFREQRFLAMIENSSTGFISIDEFGDFEIMNETARKLIGVAHTSNMARLKDELPELHEVLTQLMPGEKMTCPISNPEFSTIIQVSSSELHFKGKKHTLISLLDIKKVIEARELESWQKLIRIMNHEIMNSIAPITSVSNSLIKIFLENDKPIEIEQLNEKKICDTINGLEIIESMSSGLSNFVGHYRKLSKIPSPDIKPINVENWIEKLKRIGLEHVQKNNAKISFDINSGVNQISGDEGLLNQVMINLIKNAAEAPESNLPKEIKVELQATTNHKTHIVISNNGEPIDPDILDKIFVPFFTTKDEGAGIGLFISRQIISLHQGTISVFSNKNDGTRFQIEL